MTCDARREAVRLGVISAAPYPYYTNSRGFPIEEIMKRKPEWSEDLEVIKLLLKNLRILDV